ncbi:hypothetical protein [Yinghuangia soli]|uniref:Uncharacterized protein n=1 Tax=Yinghuangia soli TaxID=2908204 RepID=A0AA41PU76_9ACTN|nr:hypothetical protein [Yinghuangia soli]MCF2525667.1 hypothetical protein [Yinghuangia soli]
MSEVDALYVLEDLPDGVEVACTRTEDVTPSPYAWDHRFAPEKSQPGLTLWRVFDGCEGPS